MAPIDPLRSSAVVDDLRARCPWLGIAPAAVFLDDAARAALAPYVAGVQHVAAAIDVDWTRVDLAAGTALFRARIADAHPELDAQALDALAAQFSYAWR
ncbi:MAG: hypothetical protein HOO96_03810 [Polyangiaceae bacterium]|nr:hypothetical protein [Polyangiaceae bacterium]